MTEPAAPQIALAFAGTDRRRAEALARILASLGYVIAPQPTTAASVDGAAALIALWSSASINSGPIHALATQAAVQRKLVCVKTANADPPAAFSLVSLYDLSSWTGSGDAPAIRDLIEHLVRMAPPPRPVPRAPPVSAPFFVSRIAEPVPAPAVARVMSGQAPAKLAEPPSAEAIAWRQILTSDEPADFREHLEIFGEHGVYAESARQRLRQLESAPARATPAPSPAQVKAALSKAAAKPRRRQGPNFMALTAATFAIGAIAAATYYVGAPLLRRQPVLPTAIAAPEPVLTAPTIVAPAPVEAVRAAPLPQAGPDATVTATAATPPPPVQATPPAAAAPPPAVVKAAARRQSAATPGAQPATVQPAAEAAPPVRAPLILPTTLEGAPGPRSPAGVSSVNFGDTAPASSPGESAANTDQSRPFKRMESRAAPE